MTTYKVEYKVEKEGDLFVVYSYVQTNFGKRPAKNFVASYECKEGAANCIRRLKAISS